MAWTTPRTWAAAEVVTANIMNTHVRDNLKALTEWTSYTPSWTATGGTPSLGNGTLTGHYLLAGNLLAIRIALTWGSTTSATGTSVWRFSLPSGITAPPPNALQAFSYDSSANINYSAIGFGDTTTLGAGTHGGQNVGNTIPFTWATGDALVIQGVAVAS